MHFDSDLWFIILVTEGKATLSSFFQTFFRHLFFLKYMLTVSAHRKFLNILPINTINLTPWRDSHPLPSSTEAVAMANWPRSSYNGSPVSIQSFSIARPSKIYSNWFFFVRKQTIWQPWSYVWMTGDDCIFYIRAEKNVTFLSAFN
jgi:hypothetical protein